MRVLTAFMGVLTAFEGVTDRPSSACCEADQTDLHVMSALGRVLRTRNERAVWEALAEEEHLVLVLDGGEKEHLE